MIILILMLMSITAIVICPVSIAVHYAIMDMFPDGIEEIIKDIHEYMITLSKWGLLVLWIAFLAWSPVILAIIIMFYIGKFLSTVLRIS